MLFSDLRIHVAKKNPYQSITKVCLTTGIEHISYIGVKDVASIPMNLITTLQKTGLYALHTLDAHALGGRAVDMYIKNPITGRFMTGSSSGTAVNVFCDLNDLGIGTDGGGSLLAPAMALNLFGFISPLLENEHVQKYTKISTDGITFTPSIGFMTRTYKEIIQAIHIVLELPEPDKTATIMISNQDTYEYPFQTKGVMYPNVLDKRSVLLPFLKETLKSCDFLISREGPIDLEGIGDSIFAIYGKECEKSRRLAKKGLLRIVNMAGATAICIPETMLSKGFLFICESTSVKIATMLQHAEKIIYNRPELIHRYFHDLTMYESSGFQMEGER